MLRTGHLHQRLSAFALTLGLLILSGCVDRTISITSTPSGALVYLNDEEVGRTPLVTPFTFYGVYDVRLEKDGYEPMWTSERAAPPWWEYPGPDLLAEMVPNGEAHLNWHFYLVPKEEVDPDILVDHARQLRAKLNRPSDDE